MKYIEFLGLERAGIKDNVIHDVHLVGLKARNAVSAERGYYTYSESALKAAVPKYNNVDVYLSHKLVDGKLPDERLVQDKVGFISNPVYKEGKGVYGDVVLNEAHPYYEAIKWWAENAPNKVGMSHVAALQYDAVENAMTEIKKVHSVDFVAFASTTDGLYKEGVIQDKIDNERKLSIVLDTFWSLIYDVQYSTTGKPLTQAERAVKMLPLVKDLQSELKACSAVSTETETAKPDTDNSTVLASESAKEKEMKIEELTLDILKTQRKDLYDTIATEAVKANAEIDAKVADAIKDIPVAQQSKVFVKLVREAVVRNDTATVAELVADRKVVPATTTPKTVVESAHPSTTVPVTTESTKAEPTVDDVVSLVKRK